MALFVSDKRSVLNRLKRHEWQGDQELSELLEKLQALDVRLADVLWMLTDYEPVLQHLGAQVIIQNDFPQAGLTLLREALEFEGSARTSLLSVLPRLRDTTFLDRVAAWLEDKDEQRRTIAVEATLVFPAARVGTLLAKLLQSETPEHRWRALNRLLEAPGGATIDPALRKHLARLARDPDERIRVRTLQALTRWPDAALVDLLVDRLKVETPVVRQVIVRALHPLLDRDDLGAVDKLVPLLSEGDPGVHEAIVDLVQRMARPERAIEKMLVYSKQLMGWMRDRIQQTVARLGDTLTEPLLRLLGSDDPGVRSGALFFASQLTDRRIVEPIVRLLSDDDWWTQVMAVETLGRLGDERAVEPLVRCLEDPELRWAVAEALARIGSPNAIRPVAKLLADPSPDVRREAIRALEVYGHPKVLPWLERLATTDPELDVRRRAAAVHRQIALAHRVQAEAALDPQAGKDVRPVRRLDALLAETRRVGASDLHIAPDAPPYVRLFGELRRVGGRIYDEAETYAMLLEVLTPEQRGKFEHDQQLDFCYDVPEVGRYRANVYTQRRGVAGVFRVIPDGMPSFAELRLPQALSDITHFSQGLVLVCGTASSGKTTTLTCLIDLLNQTRAGHVLTLEDPIEFAHPYRTSLVNQRQVGRDTSSFARALRAALREDPDVIVVGDLRDLESIRLTVTAAETGHLVLATMSTSSATKAISRLIESFPPREQPHVRSMLAETLKMVLGQVLLPRKDKKGRVAAFELLLGTPAVSNLIRDQKLHLVPALMQMSRQLGMRTIDQSLVELLEAGLISGDQAYMHAEHKEEFEAHLSQAFLEGRYHDEA